MMQCDPQLLKDYSDEYQHALYAAVHGGFKTFSEFFKPQAESRGCTQEERENWLYWLDADGNTYCSIVYLIDNKDLARLIAIYDRIIAEDLRDVFVIVMEEHDKHIYYDMYRLWSTSYLEHHNQGLPAGDAVMPVARTPRGLMPHELRLINPKCVRMFNELEEGEGASWHDAIADGFDSFAAKLASVGESKGFSQDADGKVVTWHDGDEPACTFHYLPSPGDAKEVRDCFTAIGDSGCFLGYIIIEQIGDGKGQYDVFRASPRAWLAHNHRFWA